MHFPLLSDALEYFRMSLDLLERHTSHFYWPLGWPAALALVQWPFGASESVARGFSYCLVLTTLALQLWIVQRALRGRTDDRRRWWLAYGLILLNSPYVLYHGTQTFTLVPMAFLGTLLICAILFRRSAVAAAVIVALMTIVRFGALLLLPAVLLYLWHTAGTPRRSLLAAAVVGVAIIAAPIIWVSTSLGQFVALNTANPINLFMGNHPDTPIYETWRWGTHHDDPMKVKAFAELEQKYSLPPDSFGSPKYVAAARSEALWGVLRRPDLFALRALTRLSLLLSADSAVGADFLHRGQMALGLFFLPFMFLVSVIAKTLAVAGVAGSTWKDRHLVWVLVGALFAPHIVAFAHPSYGQMFLTCLLPLIAIGGALVDWRKLHQHRHAALASLAVILLCHVAFAGYMAMTRL
jgi:hypothetical protein